MVLQDLSLDRMNNLLPNIIQKIRTLMSMRDLFTTSIPSQDWRDHYLNNPKLIFDKEAFEGSTCKNIDMRSKLLHIVYPIMLLHEGPIIEFSLCTSQLISCCEIDEIILHLSRRDTLKKFTLRIGSGDDHELPPGFFELQQLTALELERCAFKPPETFKGFSKLVRLSFNNVSITSKVLLEFISNCPLLKDFTLIADERHLMEYWNFDFVDLFKCLPLVEHLCLSWYPIKCFATSVMLQTLPTSLVHLKCLRLHGLSFARKVDLSSALLLVTSSPNIETIAIEMEYNPKEAMSQTAMDLIDHQEYSNVTLDHLRVLEITNFTNTKTWMTLIKLILAKSPMLEKVYIVYKHVDIHDECKLLNELLLYPRASARANIISECS